MQVSTGQHRAAAWFLVIYQALVIALLPFYLWLASPSWAMIGTAVAFYFIGGISITAGYHRLYSHRCYKAHWLIELLVLFFGSTTFQGSVLRWSYDHRRHHAHVDTDDDPYTITKGFWYAHFLWLMEKPRPIDKKVVADLLQNSWVVWQHHHIKFAMIGSNVLVFLLVGWLLNDFVGSFCLVFWTRLFFLHHCTWFINSLAHTWGDQPFCKEHSAVNNFIISFLTFGEGYHNYHHTYANDYRNGVCWYHYDPSKWLIWLLSHIGATWGLRRVDPITIKKKMVIEGKNDLLKRVKQLWYVRRDDLEEKINELSDKMLEKIAEFNELKAKMKRHQAKTSEEWKELKLELKKIKKSLKQDFRRWSRLYRSISQLRPIPVPC